MRSIHCLAIMILLGVAVFFPACKGDTGPAGPAGSPVTVVYGPPTPVCSSPSSMGTTVIGADFGDTGGMLTADPVTLTSAETVSSISLYVGSGPVSGQIRFGIYNDSSNKPATLIFQTNPQNIVASSWNSASLSNLYLPAGTYWMAYVASNAFNGAYALPYPGPYSSGDNTGWTVMPATFSCSFSPYNVDTLFISVCP